MEDGFDDLDKFTQYLYTTYKASSIYCKLRIFCQDLVSDDQIQDALFHNASSWNRI